MRPEEIAGVVGLLAVAFGRETSADLFEVYEVALEDLEIEDPRAVVKRLLRTMERWPNPATLRRAILDQYGVLAPTFDQVWPQVVRWAADPQGCPQPGEIAMAALQVIGGSWAVKTGDRGVVYAQFRDAYKAEAARVDQEALERTWTGLVLTPGPQLPLTEGGSSVERSNVTTLPVRR